MARSYIQGVGMINVSGIQVQREVDPVTIIDLNIVSQSENTTTRIGYVYFDLPTGIPIGFYDMLVHFSGDYPTVTGDKALYSSFGPLIGSATPTSGTYNEVVTLEGSGLVSDSTKIFVDSLEASFISNGFNAGFTAGRFTLPNYQGLYSSNPVKASGLLSGPVDYNIAIQNDDTSGVLVNGFKMIGAPQITGLSAVTGYEGSNVTALGNQFINVTGVYFGKKPNIAGNLSGSAVAVDHDSVRITIPSGSFEANYISIFATGGIATSTSPFYVSPLPPVISGFTPLSGFALSQMTVSGYRFGSITGVSMNTETGVSHRGYEYTASTSTITFTVPTRAIDGKLRICNQGGCSLSSDTFEILNPPQPSGIFPTRGQAGDGVLLTGKYLAKPDVFFQGNFTPDSEVGLISADNIQHQGDSGIIFNVPTGAIDGVIVLTTSPNLTYTPMDTIVPSRFSSEPKLIDAWSLNQSSPNDVVLDLDVIVTSGVNSLFSTHIVATGDNQFTSWQISPTGTQNFTLGQNVITGQPTGSNYPFVGTGVIGLINARAYEDDIQAYDNTMLTFTDETEFIRTLVTGVLTGAGRMDASRLFNYSETFNFVLPNPSIGSIDPTFGRTSAEVNVFGTNLISVTGVRFSGLTAPSGVQSTISSSGNDHFSFEIPSFFSGLNTSGYILAESRGGQKAISTQYFEYEGLPQPEGISISFGRPGEMFYISGEGIEYIDAIKFGDFEAVFGVSGSV